MKDVLVLFLTEVRRCLSRRLVWVLVGLAGIAIVATSILVFVNTVDDRDRRDSGPRGPVECVTERRPDGALVRRCPVATASSEAPLKLTDLWSQRGEGDDRILLYSTVFLALGGLIGGASMVGADWRAGTMTTLLTWEPRRVRLAVARFAAVGFCAFLIGLALQMVLILGLLPSILANGSTAGADGAWFVSLLSALLRGETFVAMAAVFGAAIAMIGRNTAAALGVSFGYLIVGEAVLRGWKPKLVPWLISKNAEVFLLGYDPDSLVMRVLDLNQRRSFGAGTATLLFYTGALAAVGVVTLRSRDVAGAS